MASSPPSRSTSRTLQQKGGKVAGQPIRDLVTVNGVRVTVEDGSWGLVRASSNKPELVVVVESPVSMDSVRACARCSELAPQASSTALLAREGCHYLEVGAYNQTI
jgi:phosphomannomutase